MTHRTLVIDPEVAVLMAATGLAFGWVYFTVLKYSVMLLVGRKSWLGPLALTLGRIGAAAGFLFGAAKLGATPLLAVFIGFLLARALALRAEKWAS